MCLDCFTYKSLSRKVYGSNLDSLTFLFIKSLAQIMNNFSNFDPKKKLFIYAKMVKVLWYMIFFWKKHLSLSYFLPMMCVMLNCVFSKNFFSFGWNDQLFKN
jgi:hypothetical protein